MTPGNFISFEGGEGCGKSTQARMLAEALQAKGAEVVLTREPGGTIGAEAIRDLLLNPEGPGWNLPSEALLFAAARADHVSALIKPALAQGKWVICDRFLDSSRAYQGGEGGIPDSELMELHRIGSGGFLPDLTLLIEVSPAIAEQRVSQRDGEVRDRIGGRNAAFHAKVTTRFSEIATAEPERFLSVNGDNEMDVVHQQVLQAIDDAIGLPS